MKIVSVILTTYNSRDSVKRLVDSILKQKGIESQFSIELIVIDDCSTDDTLDILSNYNIKILTTTTNSGGPNKGRNIGLGVCTGDYICIADHDDVWLDDKIISSLQYLEEVPIVSSGYSLVNKTSGKRTERVANTTNSFIYYGKNETFLSKLVRSNTKQGAYLGSLIFRKDLKHIFFEENFGMVDFDWILRLFYQNDSIELAASKYVRYIDDINLSLKENYRRNDFYYSLMFIENYRGQFPREFNKAYKRIHGSRARYYYLIDNMQLARFYLRKAELSLKNVAYFLTSFYGSEYVKRKFNIFG